MKSSMLDVFATSQDFPTSATKNLPAAFFLVYFCASNATGFLTTPLAGGNLPLPVQASAILLMIGFLDPEEFATVVLWGGIWSLHFNFIANLLQKRAEPYCLAMCRLWSQRVVNWG